METRVPKYGRFSEPELFDEFSGKNCRLRASALGGTQITASWVRQYPLSLTAKSIMMMSPSLTETAMLSSS